MIKRVVDFTGNQTIRFIKELYECFDTGYAFEDFVKVYLEFLGFDEVVVTQRAKDGGIDLTAIKIGIGGLSSEKGKINYEPDKVIYRIQAKRYKPTGKKIPIDDIRKFRGAAGFKSGQKGIFITTGKFTSDAIKEANAKPEQPIILIDGETLIKSMLDLNLGFVFIPEFKKELINNLLQKKNIILSTSEYGSEKRRDNFISVDKLISLNDIRARIIGVPQEIINALDDDFDKIEIQMGDLSTKEYSYNKNRKYIAGVTKFFKKYGLIDDANVYHPKKVNWMKEGSNIKITILEE
ncbi:MAG: restriction endonuclease [Bacilli bacterium]